MKVRIDLKELREDANVLKTCTVKVSTSPQPCLMLIYYDFTIDCLHCWEFESDTLIQNSKLFNMPKVQNSSGMDGEDATGTFTYRIKYGSQVLHLTLISR